MDKKAQKHQYYLQNKEHILNRNRQYYLKNKERLNAASKAYAKAHPEMEKKRKNIPERRLLQKVWQKAHPERMKELKKRHYGEHKEHYAKQFHEWHVKNAVRVWARSSIQCHKTRGYAVILTTDQLTELAKKTDRCFYCEGQMRYGFKGENRQYGNAPTLDRQQNGQILEIGNVKIICRLCNMTKGPRTHEEFIAYCKKIVKMHGHGE